MSTNGGVGGVTTRTISRILLSLISLSAPFSRNQQPEILQNFVFIHVLVFTTRNKSSSLELELAAHRLEGVRLAEAGQTLQLDEAGRHFRPAWGVPSEPPRGANVFRGGASQRFLMRVRKCGTIRPSRVEDDVQLELLLFGC